MFVIGDISLNALGKYIVIILFIISNFMSDYQNIPY